MVFGKSCEECSYSFLIALADTDLAHDVMPMRTAQAISCALIDSLAGAFRRGITLVSLQRKSPQGNYSGQLAEEKCEGSSRRRS